MNFDILMALALFIGLLAFYWFNEPKAREQDQKHDQNHGQHGANGSR